MDSSVSSKDEIWFPRMCHHISNTVYRSFTQHLVGVSYPNLARYHLYTTVTDSAALQHILLQSGNLKWYMQQQSVAEGETLLCSET
jgi:hypothetical protein